MSRLQLLQTGIFEAKSNLYVWKAVTVFPNNLILSVLPEYAVEEARESAVVT